MSNANDEARRQLERLGDTLAYDVGRLTDGEVLLEASEDYGDPEKATLEIRHLVQEAVSAFGKRRLAVAREAFQALNTRGRLQLFELPTERKKELVEQFAGNDNQLREKLTMAARNQEDFEADLDSFLEDLVELGVIDDKGDVQ